MAPTITMSRGRDRTYSSSAPSTAELDRLANLLDSKFSVLGVRFGMDAVLGLVPGIGDMAGLAISAYLIGQGYRLGARKRTLARMAANVAGDSLIGSIPLLGTVADVMWKANNANMRLLKRDLARPGVTRRHQTWRAPSGAP
ncbi:DUF4112 domain-containing protein [Acuticoccus sediminis]|uniref:DUF4112 domain-containing protein n=1 Tax=Acuticoccus sediminis TaxID=2184697 RepID=A0A8B2P674_9HYPH|nr:DUF4112 domain-containing protein [Acuticoccus sediminis]RAI04069.1 DUF4112 domain-containing protein [Acuticoccus sediminis]